MVGDAAAGRRAALEDIWIPVGVPGYAGDAKARWRDVLDERFGADGWRMAHIVRGRIVPPAVAIAEYEAAYRRLPARPTGPRRVPDRRPAGTSTTTT